MSVMRDMNGIVCEDEQFEPSADHLKDIQRLPTVVDDLTEQMFRETPTVAVSALISVLSRVLLVAGSDPMNEARIVGEALKLSVREDLKTVRH